MSSSIKVIPILLGILLGIASGFENWWGIGFKVKAQPSWARKYKADCTLCHTTYPRLNRTGYEFKRLGYRLPKEVDVKQKELQPLQPGIMRNSQNTQYPLVIVPTGYKPKPSTPESERGKTVYKTLSCASCHTIGGVGGRLGPPMDGIGGRRDVNFLLAHITDPEEHVKKFPDLHGKRPNLMPHPHATPEEVVMLVAYLLTLPEPSGGFRVSPHQLGQVDDKLPAAKNYSPAPETESSLAGKKAYYELGCASCHTIGGIGGQFGPKLDGIGARRGRRFLVGHITTPQLHTQQLPDEHIAQSAIMPPTNATPEQIEQIADFLLTLPVGGEFEPTKARLADYLAVSYLPGIEIENANRKTTTTYERRDLIFYAAGPVGQYFSFFVQPIPLSEEEGFGKKFEMAQGLVNFGNARTFSQVRFGQLFNLRNAGFAGTDRGLTETLPFIFQPSNGFNPAGLGRGVSLEYTWRGTTTFKIFGNYNEAPESEIEVDEGTEGESKRIANGTSRFEEEPLFPEFRRSRNYGFVYEQVLGKKGLSGLQFEFSGGHTPFSTGDVPQGAVRFQRYSIFANKTFEDGKNFERCNLIFGLSLLRDSRFLGIEAEQRSRGYGYFFEVDTTPIAKHLSLFARYDQFRPTTLLADNTLRGKTFGVLWDPTRYTRMSFEYQHLTGIETTNRYRIGWQLNF